MNWTPGSRSGEQANQQEPPDSIPPADRKNTGTVDWENASGQSRGSPGATPTASLIRGSQQSVFQENKVQYPSKPVKSTPEQPWERGTPG